MVPHEFLGIGWGEFTLLLVLAVIFFGPEKLPEISRRAARVVHAVRLFANQATDQLKQELGPEYQDLTISDLNPKTFVHKHLLADVQDDLDGIKKELDGVRTELTGSVVDVKAANADVRSMIDESLAKPAAAAGDVGQGQPEQAAIAPAPCVPWDPEAT